MPARDARLSDAERAEAWSEIERELSRFETTGGFEGPCELLVVAGTAPGEGPAWPGSDRERSEVAPTRSSG